MEKVVFFKNEFALNELNNNLAKSKKTIQAIVIKLSEMGIEITDIQQLSGLVDNRRKLIEENFENFVFNELYKETPSGFNRSRYKQMIDLPNLEAIKESFEFLFDYMGGLYVPDLVYWHVFTIKKGQVEIIDSELQKIQSNFQEVAKTPLEIERLRIVEDVCNALNKLISHASDQPANYAINGVAQYNDQSKKFEASGTFVKNGLIDTQMIFNSFGNGKAESLKSEPVKSNQYTANPEDSEEIRMVGLANSRNDNSSTGKKL